MLIPLEARALEQGRLQTAVRSALRLYNDLEYERAMEQLSLARRYSTGAADDVLLSLYEGVILADLGKAEASSSAFKTALLLQPGVTLPVEVSPKVARRFEEVRRQVRRELAEQEARASVVVDAQAAPVAQPSPPPVESASQAAPDLQPVPLSPSAEVSGSNGLQGHAWLPATIGGVLLVGGGVAVLQARSERTGLRSNDPGIATLQDVDRSVARGQA
ncbi:hypothetical protein, partial [Corallococcus aberystwythensis]